MIFQFNKMRSALLAMTVTMFSAALAAADETAAVDQAPAGDETQQDQDLAQLQFNIHEMRRIVDGARSQRQAVTRGNSRPLIIDSRDAPGIGTMRAELSQSLDRLASRCFGNEIDADGGNVILICGNNAGSAESSNVTNSAYTTVVLEPAPEADPEVNDVPGSGDAPADTPDAQVQP